MASEARAPRGRGSGRARGGGRGGAQGSRGAPNGAPLAAQLKQLDRLQEPEEMAVLRRYRDLGVAQIRSVYGLTGLLDRSVQVPGPALSRVRPGYEGPGEWLSLLEADNALQLLKQLEERERALSRREARLPAARNRAPWTDLSPEERRILLLSQKEWNSFRGRATGAAVRPTTGETAQRAEVGRQGRQTPPARQQEEAAAVAAAATGGNDPSRRIGRHEAPVPGTGPPAQGGSCAFAQETVPVSRCKSWRRPSDGHLSYAQSVWGLYSKQFRDLYIPEWYSGLHGVPARLLRLPSGSLTLKERGLCLIVRMNYILDHPQRFSVDPRYRFFCLPARRLSTLGRAVGPLYDIESGSYRLITDGIRTRFNTAYACQLKYNWHRALACSLRNFVHLAWGFPRPPL